MGLEQFADLLYLLAALGAVGAGNGVVDQDDAHVLDCRSRTQGMHSGGGRTMLAE